MIIKVSKKNGLILSSHTDWTKHTEEGLIKSWTCMALFNWLIQMDVIVVNGTLRKWYYNNTKPYETMTYCCVEFEWYFTDSRTDQTLNSRRQRETTREEWHLHKAKWRPEGSKNRHCNKRARFAKTANVAAVCQYHLWAQQGLWGVYEWGETKKMKREWHS